MESIVAFASETWWLVPLSVFVFFASIAAVSVIAVRMPADYFCGERRERDPFPGLPPLVRRALRVSRQGLGVALVVVGILMIITPGQGLLTILIGLTLLDFKGRYALERRLVRQPPVLRTINWLRRKAGRAPLEL